MGGRRQAPLEGVVDGTGRKVCFEGVYVLLFGAVLSGKAEHFIHEVVRLVRLVAEKLARSDEAWMLLTLTDTAWQSGERLVCIQTPLRWSELRRVDGGP